MSDPQDLSIFRLSFDWFLRSFPIFRLFLSIFFRIIFPIEDCCQTFQTPVFAPNLMYMLIKMSSLLIKRACNYRLEYDFPEIRILLNVDNSYWCFRGAFSESILWVCSESIDGLKKGDGLATAERG